MNLIVIGLIVATVSFVATGSYYAVTNFKDSKQRKFYSGPHESLPEKSLG